MNITKRILISLVFAAGAMAPKLTSAATWAAEVDNASGASNVLSISALLCGTLTSTGGVPTHVQVYWGANDGGTTFALWSHTNDLGTNSVGPLSVAVADLVPNQWYYYRFYATNLNGQAWSSATTNFQTMFSAGPALVNLGSTAHFMILAGSAITCLGGGGIGGDVGLSPAAGSGITGLNAVQVHGTIYTASAGGPAGEVVDPVRLTKASGDLTVAYNDAAGRVPAPTGPFLNAGAGNLGGLTLVPGLYKFTDTVLITGSDVTLTGGPNDVWIFQLASDLEVGNGISVVLAGGAQARNIFWQVGTSVNIGTTSMFKGTIMAGTKIVMMTGSALEGRALSSTAVTFDSGLAAGGTLPSPEAPCFTDIAKTATNSTTVVLATTPYFQATVESSPDLSLTNWTTLASSTPTSNSWTFIHENALTGAPQRYYRAYLTSY